MKLLFLLAVAAAAIAGIWYFQPPIPQDSAYHQFADTMAMYGIANFFNVSSNVLIILIALLGVIKSARLNIMHVYIDVRREFGVLFTAALLVGFGSVWYHLNPTTESLVWDRLPMAIVFASLLGIVITLYVSAVAGKLLFWPLLIAGATSVLFWYQSEQAGVGDLRFYALTQYLSALLVLLILILYRGMGKPTVLLALSLTMYVLAKAAEHFDSLAYDYTGIISGHSMKHLFAGLALFMLYLILGKKHA